jgi:serine/threonine protein kinase
MMQEASLLGSLTHGNIVKYEGFIQTQEHMNIVLEYVENGSLLHTLKHFGNSLPEHLVASYCYDILQGLAYLHQQDVVHCDLKAANILTTKAGDVKLSDFGVSLNLKLKNHEENLVSGTPFWSESFVFSFV